ncbi:hypothetical protein BLOT_010525, partial [Blomia tropicalis]
EDILDHQLGRRSLGRHSRSSTWPPIIGRTFSNINLAADHWEDILDHKRIVSIEYSFDMLVAIPMFETKVMSLGRNSGTLTWPLIIEKSFSKINLAADHRDDTLEHQLILRIYELECGILETITMFKTNVMSCANHWAKLWNINLAVNH